MEKLKKTESIILAILWAISLSSYSTALVNHYDLFISDYLGLTGLTVVTLIAYFKPENTFKGVLTLLLLGLFNLLSFAYLFNIVMTFGFSILVTPGIQLISLVLLILLVATRREQTGQFYRQLIGQTEKERERASQNRKIQFKRKFEELSDHEIDIKLQEDLVPEAISAFQEIKEERKRPVSV